MTPLHHIGEFFREALLLVPLGAARALFLVTLLALLAWVLLLPERETVDRSADGTRHNLKPWAVLALLVQIVLYAFV